MLSRALVTAMVGRMSTPLAISSANTSPTRWPNGSSETILPGSNHCGCGPIVTVGCVLVRSGRASGFSARAEMASAR